MLPQSLLQAAVIQDSIQTLGMLAVLFPQSFPSLEPAQLAQVPLSSLLSRSELPADIDLHSILQTLQAASPHTVTNSTLTISGLVQNQNGALCQHDESQPPPASCGNDNHALPHSAIPLLNQRSALNEPASIASLLPSFKSATTTLGQRPKEPQVAADLPADTHHAAASGLSIASILGALESCQIAVKSLGRAKNLRDVISQVKSGEVQHFRTMFGPSEDGKRRAHEDWGSLNTTITRRECIYQQLITEFEGNEEQFFKFFAVDPSTAGTSTTLARSKAETRCRQAAACSAASL